MTVEKEKSRAGRGLRIALFASLAVNLLVVGAIAGMVIRGPAVPKGDRNDPVLPYTRAFDEDQRRALVRDLRRGLPKAGREMRAAYLQDYAAAIVLLRDDAFDPEAMVNLLDRQVMRGAELRQRGQTALIQIWTEMSSEERKAYAARLEEELQRMRDRRPGKPRG